MEIYLFIFVGIVTLMSISATFRSLESNEKKIERGQVHIKRSEELWGDNYKIANKVTTVVIAIFAVAFNLFLGYILQDYLMLVAASLLFSIHLIIRCVVLINRINTGAVAASNKRIPINIAYNIYIIYVLIILGF